MGDHRCLHQTWGYAVDPDIIGSVISGHRYGDTDHGGLGGGVGRLAVSSQTSDGGYVDDGATTAFLHLRDASSAGLVDAFSRIIW